MGAHPFWRTDCGGRGPGLTHSHGGCTGAAPNHRDCPCEDCGLTPARWEDIVHFASNEANAPLQLPQAAEGAIVERRAVRGEYRQWSERLLDYTPGDPHGPGRGDLSPAWVEWALGVEWQ